MGLLLLASFQTAFGQAAATNFPELDLPTLGSRAEELFDRDPGGAIPYMIEIRSRLASAQTEELKLIFRENLYMLGLAHMRWFQQTRDSSHLKAGIPYWEEFTRSYPYDKRFELARLNLADSYFGSEDWRPAFDVYAAVLDDDRIEQDTDELLGVLQRMQQAAENSDQQERMDEFLWLFLEAENDYEIRVYCLNTLFDRALLEEDLAVLLRIVVAINQDPELRYDLGVNLRLFNAGNQFEMEEKYLEASMLYSMVLPVEYLLAPIEDRLIDIEEQLFKGQFLQVEEAALLQARKNLRERRLKFRNAPDYTANLRWRQARVLRLMNRINEAYFAFRRLIANYPDYEHIEQFYYAAFLQGIECQYIMEAISLGEEYLNQLAFTLYEKPIAARLAQLYAKRQDVDKLRVLAYDFVPRFPDDRVSAQIVHSLGQALFSKGEIEEILETFPAWEEEFPNGAFVESVYYWTGMAYLFVGDFNAALRSFNTLIERFPGSVYMTEARFRRGVAYFGMADYKEARKVFTDWMSGVSDHPLLPEAHAFMGDLDAIDARVESALAHYKLIETLGGSMALIDHGYFESASLLLANKRYADHEQLLVGYLDRYPESLAVPEAILRLAEADKEQGAMERVFDRYRDGIERFGNQRQSDGVDQLLDAWWQLDTDVRQKYKETNAFFDRLEFEPTFRQEMLYDRMSQIQYFKEHPALPYELQEVFIRFTREYPPKDDEVIDFKHLESYESFEQIREQIQFDYAQLPEQPPAEIFLQMYSDALERGAETLGLRLLRNLNLRAGIEVDPNELGADAVAVASPAVKIWIASLHAKIDAFFAEKLLLEVVDETSQGQILAEAYFMLAGLKLNQGLFDNAADYYLLAMENDMEGPLAREAALMQANALRQAGRFDEAIKAYTEILNQRSWRGEPWAEATFRMGQCFAELGEEGKAQGFFERAYLAYGGYPDWAAEATLASADLLKRQGDLDSARRTYQFFLDLPKAAEAEKFKLIQSNLQTL